MSQRDALEATSHTAAPGAQHGTVRDIDDTARVTGHAQLLEAAWHTPAR